MKLIVAILFTTAMVAGPVTADPVSLNRQTSGFNYFNRPNAKLATHDSELRACVLEAAKTEQSVYGGGGMLVPVLSATFRITGPGVAPNIENCMVAKRWRVVHIDDAEGAELIALDRALLSAQLKGWVGSDPAHGEVVRVWNNDAAIPTTVKFSFSTPSRNRSLSLAALAPNAPDADGGTSAPSTAVQSWPAKPRGAGEVHPIGLNDLGTVSPASAVIIVRIKGLSLHNGVGLAFQRLGKLADEPAWVSDQQPDFIFPSAGTLFAKKEGNTFAYAVPPGRWRLAGMAGGIAFIDFCLGAPSFDVKAGQIIYAGTFDLSTQEVSPDLDLAPVQAWLGGEPQQAQKVLAANYSNGWTSSCVNVVRASWGVAPNFYIYAFEISGAPFASPDIASPADSSGERQLHITGQR